MIYIFLIYLALLLILARVFSRKMTGLSEFFLASRNLPPGLVTLTFVASWIGAASTIGTMDKAFTEGISAFWYMAIPSTLSLLVITWVFARKVNAIQALSMPEAFEQVYSKTGAFFLSLVILIDSITLSASQFIAAGSLLHLLTGLPIDAATWLTLGVIVVYSIIGGFRAVVMTDVLQVGLLSIALCILFGFGVAQGGLNNVWGMMTGSIETTGQLMNPFVDIRRNLMIAATFVMGWSIAPEMWQRMQAVGNRQGASKVGYGSVALTTVIFVMVVFIGLMAISVLPQLGASVGDKQNVLYVMAQQLPGQWLTALVLLGALSATFSTIDSGLNICSLTVVHDLLKRSLWPNATQTQLVLMSRLATVLCGIPAVGLALKFQDIIQVLWIAADVYASTIFIPILGMFYMPDLLTKLGRDPTIPRASGAWAIGLGIIPAALSMTAEFTALTLPSWWPGWPYTTLLGIGLSLVGYSIPWLINKPTAATT